MSEQTSVMLKPTDIMSGSHHQCSFGERPGDCRKLEHVTEQSMQQQKVRRVSTHHLSRCSAEQLIMGSNCFLLAARAAPEPASGRPAGQFQSASLFYLVYTLLKKRTSQLLEIGRFQ